MTKNVEPEVLFEMNMALAPIPGNIDAREWRENQIQSAARQGRP